MNKNVLKVLGILIILICALTFVTAVSSSSATAKDDNNATLQINTSGEWRLELVVNGNYSSCETQGNKTINLNTTTLDSVSVTVNQKSGPTDVYLIKDNKTLHEEHSKGSGIETIYFYYPIK